VQLLTPMAVRGAVKSTDGKALAGVTIIPDGVLGVDGRPYGLIEPTETKTNDQGQFELKGLPEGYFQIMTRREGYERVDSMKIWGGMVSRIASMDNGATSIAITMTAAGKLKGKVVKADGTPDGKANVHVNPLGTTAQRVGHWGGSMQVKEDGSFEFNSVPPGKYVLSADVVRSLEGNDPDAVEAEVKSGETAEVTVKSKGK